MYVIILLLGFASIHFAMLFYLVYTLIKSIEESAD